MNRPFDAKRYKRLLEGLEVVTLKLSEVIADNRAFRLDSQYFGKEALAAEAQIKRGKWELLSEVAEKVASFGAYALTNQFTYMEDGVPFLRCQNIRRGFVDFSDVLYIDNAANKLLSKSAVQPGMVLFTMSGSVGNAAVALPEWQYPVNSNQDVAKITPKKSISPHYLSAFLGSGFGRVQTARLPVGSVQQHIFLWMIERLKVGRLSGQLEAAIADAVSHAYVSERDARGRFATAESALTVALGLADWQAPQGLSYTRRASQAFAAGRMDAEYFREEYLAAAGALKQAGAIKFLPLDDLLVSLTNGHTPLHHDLTVGDVPFLCAEHVTDFDLHYDSEKRILTRHHQTELARTRVRNGDVLLSIKGRVGNFALAEDVPGDININQDVALLRFKDTLPLWWVLAFLNSPFGKLQVQQNATGGINPFLGLANVRKLLMPVFQEQVMRDIGDRTREYVLAARVARHRARELLAAAQRAVEIAIEQDEAAALVYLDGFDVAT